MLRLAALRLPTLTLSSIAIIARSASQILLSYASCSTPAVRFTASWPDLRRIVTAGQLVAMLYWERELSKVEAEMLFDMVLELLRGCEKACPMASGMIATFGELAEMLGECGLTAVSWLFLWKVLLNWTFLSAVGRSSATLEISSSAPRRALCLPPPLRPYCPPHLTLRHPSCSLSDPPARPTDTPDLTTHTQSPTDSAPSDQPTSSFPFDYSLPASFDPWVPGQSTVAFDVILLDQLGPENLNGLELGGAAMGGGAR